MGGAPVQYVIGNLPTGTTDAASFDIVLLGEPCTGDAERLLASMARVLGAKTLIAQMVPSQNEAESLTDQLAKLTAKVILALGPHSAKALLGKASEGTPFGKLRGTAHSVDGISAKAIVTYHPLQLLRQPLAKAQAWKDLKLVMKEAK
jgi:uracil-DNA glycosylase family 4